MPSSVDKDGVQDIAQTYLGIKLNSIGSSKSLGKKEEAHDPTITAEISYDNRVPDGKEEGSSPKRKEAADELGLSSKKISEPHRAAITSKLSKD